MKIFHHNDADGICSAYLVWYFSKKNATDFYEMDYATAFPFDKIIPGETIYIVDYSISPSDMKSLLSITPNVIWIDHHKTIIDKYNSSDIDISKIKGLREPDGDSAAKLTWRYFAQDEKPPKAIEYIDGWDTWRRSSEPDVKAFITALNAQSLRPSDVDDWYNIIFNQVTNQVAFAAMIVDGYFMLQYRDGYAKSVMSHIGFPFDILNLHVYACNIPHANSDFFKSITNDDNKYDAFMPFYYDGNKHIWTYSLYSCRPDIDVGSICEKYGGGGHKNAAGFSSEKLIFEKDVT